MPQEHYQRFLLRATVAALLRKSQIFDVLPQSRASFRLGERSVIFTTFVRRSLQPIRGAGTELARQAESTECEAKYSELVFGSCLSIRRLVCAVFYYETRGDLGYARLFAFLILPTDGEMALRVKMINQMRHQEQLLQSARSAAMLIWLLRNFLAYNSPVFGKMTYLILRDPMLSV